MAPCTSFDYVGMFNTAVQLDDPVLMMEHADLYEQKGEVPVQGLDYYVAYGKARVARPGEDVTS